MNWLRRGASLARHLFRHLFRKAQVEEDLDCELESYRALLADRYAAQGLSPEAAHRAAQLEFEGIEQVKGQVREVRVGSAIETCVETLRYAWRVLRRHAAFTAIAVLTLALGIGVNTAIFSVVYAELLRPLPYDNPGRLASIWVNFRRMGAPRGPASGPMLREIRRRNRLFQEIAAIWVGNATFLGTTPSEAPEQVRAASVTGNFLSLLGVHPLLGRVFDPLYHSGDDHSGDETDVVLSYAFWKRHYGGDPEIIGKGVPVRGGKVTVTGVLPEDFQLYFATDSHVPPDVGVFLPFGYDIYQDAIDKYYLRMIGRLKPGANIPEAQQDLTAVAAQLRGSFSEFAHENVELTAVSFEKDFAGSIRPVLMALFAGAGFVLLICCANVTNLLLARAHDGRRELALRWALGASQRRILGELFAEALILCAFAAVMGLLLGWAGMRVLAHISPASLTRIREVGVNWPVLGFAGAAALAAVLIFGLAPGLELRRWDLFTTLREARGAGPRSRRAVRSVLIAVEIMLGFVLVIGAGLMIRTLANIHQTRPGFDVENLLTFEIEFPGSRFAQNFIAQWEDELASMPGVVSVGATSHLPLDDYPNWYSPYRPAEIPATEAHGFIADHRCITPGYLRAAGTRLIEGRYFNQRDGAGSPQVAIVDEWLARATWPGQSAIGKRIEAEHFTANGIVPVMTEVVGVVEHVRNHSLSQRVRPEVYLPFEQSPRGHLSFVVRTSVPPASLAGAVRDALRNRAPTLALSKLRPMTFYTERATAPAGFTALLAAVFAALALLLAAIGIYGVVYYSVAQRTREMGVRVALGATPAAVVRQIMHEGLWLTAAGMALGLAGSLALARSLSNLVYGVPALDPLTYAIAIVAIPAAALAGCWRPAAKAAASNPIDAIRAE